MSDNFSWNPVHLTILILLSCISTCQSVLAQWSINTRLTSCQNSDTRLVYFRPSPSVLSQLTKYCNFCTITWTHSQGPQFNFFLGGQNFFNFSMPPVLNLKELEKTSSNFTCISVTWTDLVFSMTSFIFLDLFRYHVYTYNVLFCRFTLGGACESPPKWCLGS